MTPQERQETENLRVVSIVMSYSMGDYTDVQMENIEKFN